MENEIKKHRDIDVITHEIKELCDAAGKTMLLYAAEIGRRLVEAKEILPHGEWGRWLSEECGFSQRTANKHMQIFKAYGSAQVSLLGAELNSPTWANLSYSQALQLLSVPENEREEFAKANHVEDMSTRELERAIKERNELAEKLAGVEEELKATVEDARDYRYKYNQKAGYAEELQKKIDKQQERISELDKTVESSNKITTDLQEKYEKAKAAEKDAKKKLKELKDNPEIPPEALERIRAESEARAAEKYKAEAEQSLEDAKRQLAEAKAEAENAVSEAEQLRSEMKKREIAANKSVIEFETIFRATQENMNKLIDITNNADPDIAIKLKKALRACLERYLNM